ncbi:MAG: sialidase family protein [Phycisphaeraceae bacterium]|jgi:hypothetical protein|nr:sialidase family protein [Phycisphaeraceae bacterium]
MHIADTGLVSRCVPGTDRANLTFPAVVRLSDATLIATWRSGSTKDGDDEVIEVSRSSDGAKTWSEPEHPFSRPAISGIGGTIKLCYLTELRPGRLIAAALWVDRETYPDATRLFNPDTMGCLPMAIVLADSHDGGASWSPWREVPTPEDLGPPSLTNPVMQLPDDTLVMSIESNKHYTDASRWYQKVVMFHSTDDGRTWGEPVIAGFDPTGRIFNWDQRAAVAPDGRVGTFLWTYNADTETYLNIHRRISADGGRTWSKARDLGITDQAAHPAVLPDGRTVLAWVDRFETHSIRARMAPAIDGEFEPETQVVLYTHPVPGDDPSGAPGSTLWTFGLPYGESLSDGQVIVVYYAGTEAAMDIHWARLDVND